MPRPRLREGGEGVERGGVVVKDLRSIWLSNVVCSAQRQRQLLCTDALN